MCEGEDAEQEASAAMAPKVTLLDDELKSELHSIPLGRGGATNIGRNDVFAQDEKHISRRQLEFVLAHDSTVTVALRGSNPSFFQSSPTAKRVKLVANEPTPMPLGATVWLRKAGPAFRYPLRVSGLPP